MTDDCILASNKPNSAGYVYGTGQNRKTRGLHVLAWEKANNQSVPKDMVVLHICDNKTCVNPTHLQLATQTDNVQDAITKGKRGKRTHYLSDEDVATIRALFEADTYTQQQLADKYRIHVTSVSRIVNYKRRK